MLKICKIKNTKIKNWEKNSRENGPNSQNSRKFLPRKFLRLKYEIQRCRLMCADSSNFDSNRVSTLNPGVSYRERVSRMRGKRGSEEKSDGSKARKNYPCLGEEVDRV